MNILLVSSKYMPEYSGSGYRAHNLYKRLTAEHPEINVEVITGSETKNSCTEYIHEGLKVCRISCKSFPNLASNFLRALQISLNFHAEHAATANYMKKITKPDMVHVFGKSYVTASAIDYARRYNIPTIIELCNEMDTPLQYVPILNRLEVSAALPEKYSFVCISERLKEGCLENGIPERNLWCRPNPVDESRFRMLDDQEKFALRRKLTPFTESDTVISYIAKFAPKKNHIFLVEAIRRLPDNFKLFLGGPIVNSGPLAERDSTLFSDLKKLIVDAGLSSKIHLESGFIKNIEQYYQMSDIYGFPTLSEGLGTPLLESVACGLPVVANRIKGVTDVWIKDGANGYISDLVPELFAEKIMKATGFTVDERKIQSENILNVAGTKVIDVKYYELINGLCR